jgi:hypothetical protein
VTTPSTTFDQVDAAWNKLIPRIPADAPSFEMSDKDLMANFDDGITHVEIRREDGKLIFQQRNLYSGSLLSKTEDNTVKGFFSQDGPDFPRIALRTKDLIGLLMVNRRIKFQLADGYAKATGDGGWEGLISQCVYDGLFTTDVVGDDNGRQEQKDGQGECDVDCSVEGEEE